PAAFVGFAPQWIGEQISNNNNGWLEEEPEEEEEEEEEDEAMEDDEEEDVEAWVRGRIPNSLRFQEELSIHIAPVPRADDPYVMLVQDGIAAAIRDECERFHRTEGAFGLVCWFEKIENTFEISECVKVRKVKFATATLHGRALTWWNS
nr:putative reverse transcriptase domain-containing protein [Tanacetum cinerariifolium]